MSEVLIEQLQALLPPVSYDPEGNALLAQLTAEGTTLGDALKGLEAAENAIFPKSAGDYIADWEQTYNLTPAAGASQEERVQAVEAAMADLGCTQAYNLDGGNSATLVLGGVIQNDKSTSGERGVSDVLYFASTVDPINWR